LVEKPTSSGLSFISQEIVTVNNSIDEASNPETRRRFKFMICKLSADPAYSSSIPITGKFSLAQSPTGA